MSCCGGGAEEEDFGGPPANQYTAPPRAGVSNSAGSNALSSYFHSFTIIIV